MKLSDLVQHAANTVEDQLDRRRVLWLSVATVIYLGLTVPLAVKKLMWNDELYTYYIAVQPSVQDIWRALLTGAEQTPPVFHITARALLAVVDHRNLPMVHLAIRLPEILGFWVMCLCLFQFVGRRCAPIYAWIALLFPMVTGAYMYAFEARPYAVLLGCAGVALVCWQIAAESRRRGAALVVLALSLAFAVSNHYYAVLVIFALAIGEGVRSLATRRIDLPVWLALGVGLIGPLAVFYPLIKQSHTYSTIFWSQPQWPQLQLFYSTLLTPSTLPIAASVMLSAIFVSGRCREVPAPSASDPDIPLHEVAAACGLTVIPLMALIIAMLVTHAFTDRYALPAVLGLSLLVAWGSSRLWQRRSVPLIGFVLLMTLGFVALTRYYNQAVTTASSGSIVSRNDLARMQALLRATEAQPVLPIAVADPHTFMILAHYAEPALASRIVYLADPEEQRIHLGHNSVDQGMLDLVGPWFHVPVQPYQAFTGANQRFWLYSAGYGNYWNWLVPQLISEHRSLVVAAGDSGDSLYLVDMTTAGGRAARSIESLDRINRSNQ